MNDLEERLRAVTRAAADQIPPKSIHPLRLPADGWLRGIAARLTARMSLLGAAGPRWQRWLAPLATAAAVAGLVAGSITIARSISTHPASRPAGAKTVLAAPVTTPPPGTLPPYYATLPYSVQAGRAAPGPVMIRSTKTGKLVTTATPPKGEEFTAVSGASDDATFVLSAETQAQIRYHEKHTGQSGSDAAPARFYLLHFHATTGTARVTPLNIPAVPDATWFTLSADGTRLAVSTTTSHTVGLTVYWLATGAARSWTQSTYLGGKRKWLAAYGDSWTEGDKVEVAVFTPKGHAGVIGLLDTSGPGGSLVAAIHPLAPGPCAGDSLDPDGNLGFGAVLTRGSIPWRLQECAFSHGQARVIVPGRTIFYKNQTVDLSGEFWTSPDGGTLLADGVAGPAQAPMTAVAGLLAGNQIRAIPDSGSIPQVNIWPGDAASW